MKKTSYNISEFQEKSTKQTFNSVSFNWWYTSSGLGILEGEGNPVASFETDRVGENVRLVVIKIK